MTEDMPGAAAPTIETPEAGAATESAESMSATKAVQGIATELKTLGQQFATVLKAAATTPEAEQLSAQIREGLSSLRDEIDDALSGVRTGTKKVAGDQASNVMGRAQVELANALHVLSRGIDKLASSVGPDDDGIEGAVADVTAAAESAASAVTDAAGDAATAMKNATKAG